MAEAQLPKASDYVDELLKEAEKRAKDKEEGKKQEQNQKSQKETKIEKEDKTVVKTEDTDKN